MMENLPPAAATAVTSVLILAMLSASTALYLPSNWSAAATEDTWPTRLKRAVPPDSGPPATPSRISILSHNHPVGNIPNSFVTWGDRISLCSYSEKTWPYVIVNFYYRLSADDNIRRPLNIYCWKVNVCLYMDFPLTLKHISIPFAKNAQTYTLHIGATVSYKGQLQPSLEPQEQLLLVVEERIGYGFNDTGMASSDAVVPSSTTWTRLLAAAAAAVSCCLSPVLTLTLTL